MMSPNVACRLGDIKATSKIVNVASPDFRRNAQPYKEFMENYKQLEMEIEKITEVFTKRYMDE